MPSLGQLGEDRLSSAWVGLKPPFVNPLSGFVSLCLPFSVCALGATVEAKIGRAMLREAMQRVGIAGLQETVQI